MRFLIACFIATTCLSLGCSVVGIRTAEELSYDVVTKDDTIEIRRYAPHVAAQASLDGDQEATQGTLFRVLAGYIFGKNTDREEIAMTAPVVMNQSKDQNGTPIAMTAPVTMTPSETNRWTMAFSMPAKYSLKTLPQPVDERVTLVEMPARTVAVVRYTGSFNNAENRADSLAALTGWLDKHPKYRAIGQPFYAGYDPPFTIPFLRRNEVLIEVEGLHQ